jgi:DNA-directed RNA polymerase subunit RPC12/RpoP
MKRTTELKAVLLARMEAELDRLFEELEEHPRPTLTQIEDAVLRFRDQIGRTATDAVVNAQESVQQSPGPKCPTCGQEMRVKGRKSKALQTRLGDLEARRGYYHCPRCQRGFFPPR